MKVSSRGKMAASRKLITLITTSDGIANQVGVFLTKAAAGPASSVIREPALMITHCRLMLAQYFGYTFATALKALNPTLGLPPKEPDAEEAIKPSPIGLCLPRQYVRGGCCRLRDRGQGAVARACNLLSAGC